MEKVTENKAGAKAPEKAKTGTESNTGARPGADTKPGTGTAVPGGAGAKTTEVGKGGPKGTAKTDPLVESLKKAYPKERVFYLTTDRQAFLGRDKDLALLHQRGLPDGGELQTVNV